MQEETLQSPNLNYDVSLSRLSSMRSHKQDKVANKLVSFDVNLGNHKSKAEKKNE